MDDYLKPEDSQLLDRLVDDELTDTERRELLLRLERTPDGWRRCALAFLEQQTWRGETKAWTNGTPETQIRSAPASVARRTWSTASAWTPLATAACVLVALGVWAVLRDRDGSEPARIYRPEGAGVATSATPGTASQRGSAPNMRFVVDGGPNQNDEVVEVPLVDAGQMDEALFGTWPQSVPPEVLQMLERSGHQVVRERRLMPFDLRDGRRVVVPMDQVEIHPVGNMNKFQ